MNILEVKANYKEGISRMEKTILKKVDDMIYFITIADINPGNSLQKAVKEMASKIDHRINSNPDQFEKDMKEQIRILNEHHPRCTPVRISDSRRHSLVKDSDFSFFLNAGNWYLHIYFHAIKGEAEL